MSTYMMNPVEMTDEQIVGWLGDFSVNHPTMDYMSEWSWARKVYAEASARGLR